MALFIDVTGGLDGEIFDDLLQIVRCDPGLFTYLPSSIGSGGGLPARSRQVTYQQKRAGVASSNFLLTLIEHPGSVLIVGVDSTWVSPDDGTPITTHAAVFFYDIPGTLPTIYIDMTAAAGEGYFAYDKAGNEIDDPRPVVLYHELAHALHYLKGDLPTSVPAAEAQAITDENVFRAQLKLPLRHPTMVAGGPGAGGGAAFPRCTPTQTGFNWDCIVATAAVGSPHAPEVETLRRAKREYRSLSRWAAVIAEPVLDAYGTFSPIVVRDMQEDLALRDAMLLYAVQPAFHLLPMIEAYLEVDWDSPLLLAQVDHSMDQYVADVATAGGSESAVAAAANAARLAAHQVNSDFAPPSISLDARRTAGDDLFSYLAAAMVEHGGAPAGFAWGLEGLALFLQRAAARLGGRVGTPPEFLHALGAWLARPPIPVEQLSIADAAEELKVLGERVFTRSDTRELFAQHLLARWPDDSVPALQALLQDLGYIPIDKRNTE